MKKYKLQNLDCADCAFKIEGRLKELEGVKEVSVNFATETLIIDADDIDKAIEEVKRIEPDVSVKPLESSYEKEEEENGHKKIFMLVLSGSLFLFGLIFKPFLQNTSFFIGEYAVFLAAYLLSGNRVLLSALRNIGRGQIFDENFLMTVATLGAIAIHELPEAVGVMLFFEVGEYFQDLAVGNSRRSIKALLAARPNYANIVTNEGIKKVSAQEVKVGDIVLVKPGEKVPVDGAIVEGTSQIDTSPLTGEPVPRKVEEGSKIFAGMINISSSLKVKVEKPFEDTSFSKIARLTENALSRKASTEKFITRFAKYYTPIVVFTAMGTAFVPPLLMPGATFSEWVYRALILLVISCPCALVISIPLGYFGGIGASSKIGILIKGSNFLDNLSKLKKVVFDKTGTLTKGVFKVADIVPKNGISKEGLLEISAYAESQSNHPIAKSIIEAYNDEIDISIIKEYKDIPGYGIYAKIDNKDVYLGNDRLLHKNNIPHDTCKVGGTVVHVIVNNIYMGYILISDIVKEDARETISKLKNLGIKGIIMLTGDNEETAKKVAEKLGVDKYYAGLLPSEKLEILEKIMESEKDKVAFVGDGINDAPVIARADVGIAMGGLGQDAAIEAADVVIMSDKPSKIIDGIHIGRKTRRIIWQNIIFALSVKGFFLGLGITGIATMWEAVFADVGVALISIFNAGRILYNFRNKY